MMKPTLLGGVILGAGMMTNRPPFLDLVSSVSYAGAIEKAGRFAMNQYTGSQLRCYYGPKSHGLGEVGGRHR